MKKNIHLMLLAGILLMTAQLPCEAKGKKEKEKTAESCLYLMATDYVKADGQTDVADAIQKLIDDNPNRTIYFPDGVYMISHSILTPADPTKAVHLVLANFATFKAMENWQGGPLVRLGGEHPYNSITINGSNYGIEGGIFDGSNIADGISIDSGRETRVCHASIKHVKTGIYVMDGANYGSSDADIVDVNIVCNGDAESIGILIEGNDNTFSNMRISTCNTGVWCKSSGNSMKNIHPLSGAHYETSCGFRIEGTNNWFDYCYSDHFGTGFKLGRKSYNHFTFCWAYWYSEKVPFQVGIECDGPLESYFEGLRFGFRGDNVTKTLLKAEKGGRGWIDCTRMPGCEFTPDDVSKEYTRQRCME